jgi:hypothetical protein
MFLARFEKGETDSAFKKLAASFQAAPNPKVRG